MNHLSREEFEALVMGLAPTLDGSVRQHLADCVECAARLAREAQLESDLYEVVLAAPEDAVVRRARPVFNRIWRMTLAAAAALVVVLGARFLLQGRRNPAPSSPHASAALPDRTPHLDDPCSLGPAACVLPPQDVCRYVSVEKSRHLSF